MDEYTMMKPKRSGGKILLIVFAFILGCATLGLGLGAGYRAVAHFFPVSEPVIEATEAEDSGVVTVRTNPLVVPINPVEPSFSNIIPLVKDAVVSINVLAQTQTRFGVQESPGSGSGFIFAEDTDYIYIATNNHVVEGANIITVSLDDEASATAVIVGADPGSDIAVLAVSRADMIEKGIPFMIAALGDSDALRMGDAVVAIGNAMGEGQTVTQGIVSALDLEITISDASLPNALHLNVLQTDAAVNRGNSGGPLINANGEVIGIVTAKLFGNSVEGMGYALPMNEARIIMEELMSNGVVRQPFFGITWSPIDEFTRSLFNLPSTGLMIATIEQGSPADLAGLTLRDIIIGFNDRDTRTHDDLIAARDASRIGEVVVIHFYRGTERMSAELTLGSIIR